MEELDVKMSKFSLLELELKSKYEWHRMSKTVTKDGKVFGIGYCWPSKSNPEMTVQFIKKVNEWNFKPGLALVDDEPGSFSYEEMVMFTKMLEVLNEEGWKDV